MTVKVRSSAGDKKSNDSTPDLDSPSSITSGDLLVVFFLINNDAGQSISAPSGFTERDSVSDVAAGAGGSAYYVWTKRADATDAANQGTAGYYAFTGMNGSDDTLYGIFSLYDDAAGTVTYQASSLQETLETGGGTSHGVTGQAIAYDASLSLTVWTARGGTAQFQIDVNELYSPTGGANVAFYHTGWTTNSMDGAELVAASAEFDVSDSPTGTLTVTHNALASDVDVYSMSATFEIVPTSSVTTFSGIGRGIGRGIARGIG